MHHTNYHQVKLGEDNFGALANSKLQVFLHRIEVRNNNHDTIIGKGELSFNKIFLSKDYFYTDDLEIYNYIQEELQPEEEKEKGGKRNQNKKIVGR
jgi:hypothetical protein